MKIEVRCPSCGKGYRVDEGRIPPSGRSVPCQACGARITIRPPARESRTVARPRRPDALEPPSEVCCPRCGLHFVPSSGAVTTAGDRRTVLLVEDMDYFIEIARDALASRYDVQVAKSVEEARARLARGGVDLLLLDLTLEGGEDGLDLLRGSPGKTCPVLLLTAKDESEMYGEEWEALKSIGVDDVVVKGINMGEPLHRKVAALLGEPLAADAPIR